MTATHLYSTREGALTARTALCLGRSDLLAVPLQAGDSLRSERGTVWITVDGRPQDILLEPGHEHVVPDAISTSMARHSFVKSSTIFRQRNRRPSTNPSDTKSIDQL